MHKSIAAAVIVSLAATSAYPQQPAPETVRLPEVSVSATRTERDVNEVPATVTVIPGEEIEQKQVRDIRDLIRYEPGVEVPTNTAGGGPGTFTRNPNRPGNSGYSIRGIEGNRVQIVVDGIRVPDGFSFGSFAAPSRDLVDLDLLSRVEILRGPASSLYGSDALGGVVSYTTVDPADLLKRLGGRSYFFGRGAFAGADESLGANAGFALDTGAMQMLAIVTRREGHEIDNKGTNGAADRTAYLVRNEPNPADYKNDGLLAKLVFPLSARDRVRLTVDAREQATSFVALNAIGTPVAPRFYSDLRGNDSFEHTRVSADWEHRDADAKWLHGLRWTVYGLDSNSLQLTAVRLASQATGVVNRLRDLSFSFEQRTIGTQLQLETRAKLLQSSHRLIYGIDYYRQKTEELRDGTERNAPAFAPANCLGAVGVNCAFAVEVYPVRDFPNSTTSQTALFAQDEIQIGRLTLIPGLRHDRYELEPESDSIFAADNPGITPARLKFSSTTPRLGALWQLTDVHSLYGQVAKGFRAPPYNDVNIGFTNLLFGYTAVPNPNLKPEKSTGLELGWRATGAAGSVGLAWFDNRYRDFIDSQFMLQCPGDPSCSPLVPTTFQSVNRARVRIYGLEARGERRIARDWTLRGAYAWAHGGDQSAGVALNSVAPAKLVLGVQWRDKKGPFGAEAVMTAAAKKTRIDSSQYGAGVTPFASPSYQVFDLFGWWRPAKGVTVQAGLFNVFDKKYWLWSNARLLNANAQNLDLFSSPGRNLSASAKLEF